MLPVHDMTSANQKPVKTRWGCLAMPMLLTLLIVAARVQSIWLERQPLSYHLRRVFKESGFEVPAYVSEIAGFKGIVDFQEGLPGFGVVCGPHGGHRKVHAPAEKTLERSRIVPADR